MPRPFRQILLAISLVAIVAGILPAQGKARSKPDTTSKTAPDSDLPVLPTRRATFATDEGTWMSLDVSPDGRTVVFDLVGDLYTMPIAGGAAKRITSGMGFDGQPRFSPDGKTIAFTSDRSGYENLWLVDADGGHPRALTKDKSAQYISPEWTPDGQYIVVSRTTGSVLASRYDLTMINIDGGSGVKLTGSGTASGTPAPGTPPPFDNALGAAFGSDGRYIYASIKRGGFKYDQMLNDAWQLGVYDRSTGRMFIRSTNVGGGLRPALSADGQWLAYGSRTDGITGLKLRNLASGDESWLVRTITRDDTESRYTRDVLPGYSFTPDSKAIVISYGGKFWSVTVPSGAATAIPFTADLDVPMGPLVRFEYPINDSLLTVRQIRGARPSPDGRRLAFTALDKLWLMDLSGCPATGCVPHRVTSDRAGEHSPVWSPDGSWLAWVTWTEEGGDVWRIGTDNAAAAPEKLSRQPAFYENLSYDPTGRRLVVARGPRQQRTARENEFIDPGPQVMELVWLPATGGETTLITPLDNYGRPHFTSDTTRVFLYDPAAGLLSMRWDGTDRKAHFKVTGYLAPGAPEGAQPDAPDEMILSPDGNQVLVSIDNRLYLASVPVSGGRTPTISVVAPEAAVPVRQITRVGGDFIGWAADGRALYWSLGRSFFRYDVATARAAVRDSTRRADSLAKAKVKPDTTAKPSPAYRPVRLDVTITVPKDRPTGSVVLRGARIITMKGDEIIENGDLVITNNRITAVGRSGSVPIPAGARTIEVAGKTIIPGYVDIHAHMWPTFGVHRTQVYEYLVNLAYGVTTTRDPQTSTTDVLSYGDLVETGEMIGPRINTTGPGVFWTDDLSSLADAKEVMTRYSDFYKTNTLKQYMVGQRMLRQWTLLAAREQSISPTLEGGLDFKKNLTEAIDGYAGSEHAYPITPLYRDVVQTIAASGITYTPTLLVQYGGPFGENYWFSHYNIHDDAKLKRFTPHDELDRRGLRRPGWFRDDQYSFSQVATQAAKIIAAGGRVGLGGHGELQGLGVHFELWSIASGGMKPHDVLRVGTIFGAEAIGLGKDLGSLEAGKLADLQVLDQDPLADIKNTNSIRLVMKNGRLYEGATLKEIWPRVKEIDPPYWWKDSAP